MIARLWSGYNVNGKGASPSGVERLSVSAEEVLTGLRQLFVSQVRTALGPRSAQVVASEGGKNLG